MAEPPPGPGRRAEPLEPTYTAVVCADGRVLPIVECLGRRVLGEIDPGSREGRELLAGGRVRLWSDSGKPIDRLPAEVVLRETRPPGGASVLRHAQVSRWKPEG